MFGNFLEGIKRAGRAAAGFFMLHWRKIAYYAGVVLVLGAVAYAAEVYRREGGAEEFVLPAADIRTAAPEEMMPEIVVPEGTELLRAFSDEPDWNTELSQWECHAGTDYCTEDGEIAAFCGGVISAIGTDVRMGNYMEIQSGMLVLKYGSVTANEEMKEGKRVKAGEKIGTADGSMPCGQYRQPHLHLEARYKGKSVDIDAYSAQCMKLASNS